MGFEVVDSSVLGGENMIFFFLRIEVGGVGGVSSIFSISLGVKISSISFGIDISLNRSVSFASTTDSLEEEADEDDDEEADEDESSLDARTGFLDKDAGLSFFRRIRWSAGPTATLDLSRSLM